MLAHGWAVLDAPAFPILGTGDAEPNDSFITQLCASAAAAVDALCEAGVGDRDRMAVGGHSYGAFMTSHLLSHTDLFRAGIARSVSRRCASQGCFRVMCNPPVLPCKLIAIATASPTMTANVGLRTAVSVQGAYNRSLTPFGFQSEQRTFWDATEL